MSFPLLNFRFRFLVRIFLLCFPNQCPGLLKVWFSESKQKRASQKERRSKGFWWSSFSLSVLTLLEPGLVYEGWVAAFLSTILRERVEACLLLKVKVLEEA